MADLRHSGLVVGMVVTVPTIMTMMIVPGSQMVVVGVAVVAVHRRRLGCRQRRVDR